MAAVTKEYTDLEDRGTFKVVDETPSIKTVPITWVFTYKTDTNGYLTKFKARLCVRGDLQEFFLVACPFDRLQLLYL